MSGKNGQNGDQQKDPKKRGILERLNLNPFTKEETEKSAEAESAESDKWGETRIAGGRFGPGNPGGGRKPGVKSLRQMVREKGEVIVEQDEKRRTFAQLLVDRLWMNAVAGSERAINMVIESVDGPMVPPEPPPKPIEIYSVSFEGTTIINRRDEEKEDELIRQGNYIDVPGEIVEKDE